jgi:hypothetical protein
MTCPCCAEGFATRYGHRCPDCGSSVEKQREYAKRFHNFAIVDTRRMAETENTGSVRSTGSGGAAPQQSPNISPKTCPS